MLDPRFLKAIEQHIGRWSRVTDEGRALAKLVRDMIVERQRLLIREANYLRGLVGLPPVRADAKGEGESGRK